MSIRDIFETLDYGPAPESDDVAQAWLERHGRRFGHFIGGRFTKPNSSTFATHHPGDGSELAQVSQGDKRDVSKAVKAAREALPAWQALGPHGRARYLYALARHVQKHARLLAVLESLDNGKPIRETRDIDVPLVARHFYHHAGWAQLLPDEFPGYEAVGVCGQIIPWNFPLLMLSWKVAPALAAGNTVVLKPAEFTPLTALAFAELAVEVGLPDGVLNIVTGDGATGAALVDHEDVDKIAFTGSTQTGRAIIEASKTNFKRISLELGGKSPTFIFADADLKKAVPAAVMGIFFNAGQVCAAGSRLFVAEEVADQVLEGIAGMAKMLRVGHTLDPETIIGPLVSEQQLDRVTGYIESGRQEGATVLVGGGRKEGPGWFVEPTVLVDTEASMKVRREEIFGPVLCAHRFTDADDADRLARMGNETEFGLAASIWTRDISMAHKLARRLKAPHPHRSPSFQDLAPGPVRP